MRYPVLFVALSLAGCLGGGIRPQASDPDSRREQAEVVPLGGGAEDSLNVQEKDASDWKAIDVPEEGKLRVVVYFGNRSCFCRVDLFDPNGKRLATHTDIGSRPRTDLLVENARPGRYFLRFSARYDGDFSAYFVEPVFYAAAKPKAPVVDEPEEDPFFTENDSSDTNNIATEEEPQVIEASIIKSRAGKPGYLILTLDKGSEDGLTEGAQGVIVGLEGGEIRLTRVDKKTSLAETAVTAKALKGHKQVAITRKP